MRLRLRCSYHTRYVTFAVYARFTRGWITPTALPHGSRQVGLPLRCRLPHVRYGLLPFTHATLLHVPATFNTLPVYRAPSLHWVAGRSAVRCLVPVVPAVYALYVPRVHTRLVVFTRFIAGLPRPLVTLRAFARLPLRTFAVRTRIRLVVAHVLPRYAHTRSRTCRLRSAVYRFGYGYGLLHGSVRFTRLLLTFLPVGLITFTYTAVTFLRFGCSGSRLLHVLHAVPVYHIYATATTFNLHTTRLLHFAGWLLRLRLRLLRLRLRTVRWLYTPTPLPHTLPLPRSLRGLPLDCGYTLLHHGCHYGYLAVPGWLYRSAHAVGFFGWVYGYRLVRSAVVWCQFGYGYYDTVIGLIHTYYATLYRLPPVRLYTYLRTPLHCYRFVIYRLQFYRLQLPACTPAATRYYLRVAHVYTTVARIGYLPVIQYWLLVIPPNVTTLLRY